MKQHTILIVDNEKSVVNALKRILWKEGYRILTALSGNEALAKMETFPCQLVLADQKMPEMSGMELLKRVKEKYPDTIRILITAQIDFNQSNREIEQNLIYKCITKPWEPDELKMIIRKGLERFREPTQKQD